MFISGVSSQIKLRAEIMDHDLSGCLETIHQSRLDRLLQGMHVQQLLEPDTSRGSECQRANMG